MSRFRLCGCGCFTESDPCFYCRKPDSHYRKPDLEEGNLMPSLYKTETRQWLDYFCVKDMRDIGNTVEFRQMVERLHVKVTNPARYFLHDGLLFILTHDSRFCFQLKDHQAYCVIGGVAHESLPFD